MKTRLILGFLLPALILLPGCYTVLFIEPSDEVVSYNPDPPLPYDPTPWPDPAPPPPPPPWPPHFPPPPPPPPTGPDIVVIQPTPAPTTPDIQRPIRTDRGPLDLNDRPKRNDDNRTGTRDSGTQRSPR